MISHNQRPGSDVPQLKHSTAVAPALAPSWLAFSQLKPHARLRLFCFPYAGGGTMTFRKWPEHLPPDVELCLVQLPGRESRLREPPLTDLSATVAALGDAISPYLDKPFAFFGHSMGAMISFELTRLLRRKGENMPSQLFLSGRRAPQIPRAEPPTYDLPDEQFINQVFNLNGTPKQVLDNPELMQMMLPLLRADFAACQTYHYQHEPPLSCPLTVLGGLQDHGTNRALLEAWREQTTARFLLRMLPGDHFFLNTARVQLLHVLGRELQEIGSRRRG